MECYATHVNAIVLFVFFFWRRRLLPSLSQQSLSLTLHESLACVYFLLCVEDSFGKQDRSGGGGGGALFALHRSVVLWEEEGAAIIGRTPLILRVQNFPSYSPTYFLSPKKGRSALEVPFHPHPPPQREREREERGASGREIPMKMQ